MNPPPHSRTRRAFTLLELLVTITIIAILSTLAYSLTQRGIQRAYALHCTGNLRNLGSALQLYLADHQGSFPKLVSAREDKNSEEPAIDNTLDEYTESKEVFHCRADHGQFFEKTGTSYFWNTLLNDQNIASLRFLATREANRIPVISDKENFHRYQGIEVNILFADGAVKKDMQFSVNH